MIAMALAGMLTGAMLTLFTSGTKELVRMFHYCDLNGSIQLTVDTLTRDVRNANRVTAYTPTSLVLEAVNAPPVAYIFDPAGRTLTRTQGGRPQELLTDCESLTFRLSARNPMKAFGGFLPTANPADCKVVSVSIKSFRMLLGRKQITENVTTANIVIRRQ